MIKTVGRFFCGFALGWLIYMVAMAVTVYDGLFSLILQPFMAAFFSAVFVMLAYFFGLLLRPSKIRMAWSRVGWWALLLTVAAIGAMVFHSSLGLQVELLDPETNEKFKTISPVAGVIFYFMAIFPVVNLPEKEESESEGMRSS